MMMMMMLMHGKASENEPVSSLSATLSRCESVPRHTEACRWKHNTDVHYFTAIEHKTNGTSSLSE